MRQRPVGLLLQAGGPTGGSVPQDIVRDPATRLVAMAERAAIEPPHILRLWLTQCVRTGEYVMLHSIVGNLEACAREIVVRKLFIQ